MQRINRLLSGSPSRGRWGAIAVLGALSLSGVLLLAQLGLAGGQLPDLRVTSSTAGALGPGDYREITANGLDKQRYYRANVDVQGRLTQIYRENGEARPIDAGVTRWLNEVSRISVPATPAEFAMAHELPPEARIELRPEMKAMFALVARHPNVVARLGSPATVTPKQISGNIELDDDGGEADIGVEMRGPKGTAIVDVEAELHNRVWTFKSIDAR